MRFPIIAAALVLAGCTSPSDLLRRAPELSATTSKDAKAYALCVYPHWQDYRSTSILSETENGYRIVAGSEMNGQTDDVLDVRRVAGGASVRLYQRMAWQQMGRGELRKSFHDCL